MDAASPELARAWQLYFRQRGGSGPSLPPDVLPVVILDDNTLGPYPPYRSFMASARATPIGGVYARVGIKNCDGFPVGGGLLGTPSVPRSVAVIDWLIYYGPAGAGEIFLTLTHHNLNDIDGVVNDVDDTAPEKDPTPGATRPQLGNVRTGPRITGATLFGNVLVPGVVDGLPRRIDGPWVLGPGQILYVERNLVNSQLDVHFRGRFYQAP